MRNKLQQSISTCVNQKKVKSSRKEYVMWAWLKFWPNEKHFPKTISQWEFDYGLLKSLLRIIVTCDFSQSYFKLRRGILPLLTKYVSNLKTTGHIMIKSFLWTKLLENLLLERYLISVIIVSFLNFLSERATIWVFSSSKLQFFLITNI